MRRLLLRKIEAQTSGAWDEVDRVTGWLQIVKEAARSVKRRKCFAHSLAPCARRRPRRTCLPRDNIRTCRQWDDS